MYSRVLIMFEKYQLFENYMKTCMSDSAHDTEHIYRVLNLCLELAKYENSVDFDILIISALLHDIGREIQFKNPSLCHAKVGSEKAYNFLIENNYSKELAEKVKHCIFTHRFRSENPPETIEAKILFDADKLDACGLIGIARTLMYKGKVNEPLYVKINGKISNGEQLNEISFFQEYKRKLEKLYDKFYTKRGKEIALNRQKNAVFFYENLYSELIQFY